MRVARIAKSFWNVVTLPVHVVSIVTGNKEFRNNAVLGSEALNRRGLHVWRVLAAARVVAWRRRRMSHILADHERLFFEERGYIVRYNLLPKEEFKRLVAEVESMQAPAREMTEGGAVTRRIPLTPDVRRRYPAIDAFLNSGLWTDPIHYVGGFKVEPVLSVQTIFGAQSVGVNAKDPQTDLHMDTFHSTVKAWFFLYDVPADEGPFTYVAGSHKLTRRRLAWHKRKSIEASRLPTGGSFRLKPKDLARLRLPSPTTFAVPGNTLVVGDTFGFHARGYSARPTVRIELYASQRPNPFLPFTSLDTALLPWVSGRKEVIGWTMQDWLARFGLSRVIWKSVGSVHPNDPVPPHP